jgi:hypothetical protein
MMNYDSTAKEFKLTPTPQTQEQEEEYLESGYRSQLHHQTA